MQLPASDEATRNRTIALAAFTVASVVTLLYATSRTNYLFFHSTIEFFSIAVGFMVFIVAWFARKVSRNDYLSFLGATMLPIALIILVHTFAYKGMQVFGDLDPNITTQLWIASRYLLATAFALAPLNTAFRARMPSVLAAFSVAAFVLVASIMLWHAFPTAFVAGKGLTSFKIVSEYLVIIILGLSIWLLRNSKTAMDPDVIRLVTGATASFMAAELLFTLYTDVYGVMNVAGHLAQFVAFFLLLSALVRTVITCPMNLVFRDLRVNEERLVRANRMLSMLSATRSAVAEAVDEGDLLEEVCRIAVEVGGFRMAWVGIAIDDEARTVGPVGQFGADTDYLSCIRVTWDDSATGMGPVGSAVKTGDVSVVQDVEADMAVPWAGPAVANRYASIAALPFGRGDSVFAVLALCSEEVDGFPEEDLSTIRDLVDGVGVGMESIALREQREDAIRALEFERQQLETLVAHRTGDLSAANEDLVRLNEELREATAAKSAFLARMSHELRTPLNSVIGFSGVLTQGLAGPLNEEQRTQIDMVNRSGRHLLALVDDVLDLARIEAGRTEIAPEVIDPRELVTEVVEAVRPLAERKGLDLTADPSNAEGVLYSDCGKIRQILFNLVGNAVKFTASGSVVLALAEEPDGGFSFTVSDTGPGIAESDQPGIFDAFTQITKPGELESEGTGLGLRISREFAHLLGGELTVESRLGTGSTFTLRLPATPPRIGEGAVDAIA